MDSRAIHLRDVLRTFRNCKALGEGAMVQVTDADLHRLIDPDANSIAVIVKHVGGNLKSRFRDFLTSDGEKPDRNRDGEFEMRRPASRDEIMAWWNDGWQVALDAIGALAAEDLAREVRIRDETFAVVEALNRSAGHTAYHVGQIVLLAKHFAGPNWKSLSIPKGQSGQYLEGHFKSGIIPGRTP